LGHEKSLSENSKHKSLKQRMHVRRKEEKVVGN
jgi:hypothetical protein